jgi:hypothetical protein
VPEGVARRAPGEPLNGRARALTPGQRHRAAVPLLI